MDWYPLYNSLRIAAISTGIIFFLGIGAAYYVAKAPRLVKGLLDVVFTLPLVLPPTVVGYLLLRVLGPKRIVGAWFLEHFDLKLTMTWWSAIFATTHECLGIPVTSIFDPSSLPDYASFDSRDCPLCKAGQHIDALVNSFGYSAL